MRYTQIVLLEYDRSKTVATYGQKLLDVAVNDKWFVSQYNNALPGLDIRQAAKTKPEQVLDYLMTWIERGDPTTHKEYSQAIAKMYSQGQSKLEDIASTLVDYLTKFDKLKRRKKIQPPRNDFNRYRSIEDFYDVVDEYPDEEAEAPQEEKKNTTELYRDSKLIVLIPNDVDAACYYGQGTRWCTAGKNNNMYSYYTKNNTQPLYIIIPRQPAYPNEKYQFHFETKQFMNEQDRQIGPDGMTALVKRFPELPRILQNPVEKFSYIPLLSNEYKTIVKEFTPEAAKRTAELVEQYADRIAAFGFKSLGEYGIDLPSDSQKEIASAMRDYFAQCIKAMQAKDGFWSKLSNSAGIERNEDKIETMLSSDQSLHIAAETSTAGQALILALKNYSSRGLNTKLHKDAIPHIQDLVLRDPLFRFCMKQIPKMYTAKLQEHGHALQ